MPFGGTTVGIATFSAIKVVGYSAAGLYLNRREALSRPHPVFFGVTRAAIGVAVGTSYAYALSRADIVNSEFAFYPGLIPLRFAEWMLVLWWFYRSVPAYKERRFDTLASESHGRFC